METIRNVPGGDSPSYGYYGLKALVISYIITQIVNQIITYFFVEQDLRLVGYIVLFVQGWLGFSAGLIGRKLDHGILWTLAGPLYVLWTIKRPFKILVFCITMTAVGFGLTFTDDDFNGMWSAWITVAQYFGFCSCFLILTLYEFSSVTVQDNPAYSFWVVLTSPLLGLFLLFTSISSRVRRFIHSK